MNARIRRTGLGMKAAHAVLAWGFALFACTLPLRSAADVSLHGRDVSKVMDTAVAYHYHSRIRKRGAEAACYFDPQVEKSMRCDWRGGFPRSDSHAHKKWVGRELGRRCRKAGGKKCVPFFRNGKLEFDGLSPKDTKRLEAVLQRISSDDVEATSPPDGFRVFSKFRTGYARTRDFWDDYRKKNSLKNVHYAICSDDRSTWAAFASQGHGTRLHNVRKMCVLKCNAVAQWFAIDSMCHVMYEDGQFSNAAAERAVMGES